MRHLFRLRTEKCDPAHARPVSGLATSHIALPPPTVSGGLPIMEAFSKRRTTRRFATSELDEPTLSQLLWAADGVNRSGSDGNGGRTAP
jgi:hypothetical protein